MNSPSPLIPEGSNLEQQNKVRSSLKVKIFCAIGVNVAVLLVLLMQGCKRETPPAVETPQVDPMAAYDASNQPPVYDGSNPPPVVDVGGSNAAPVVDHTQVVPPTLPVAPPTAAATEYKIEKGDSFYTIAKKFGVTTKAIQAANPTVDPAKLQIGKTIQIPAATAAVTPTAGGPVVDAGSGETTHTVKSGDTLSKLATEYHTTVKAIQSANNLKDTRIKVGDKLKIPSK